MLDVQQSPLPYVFAGSQDGIVDDALPVERADTLQERLHLLHREGPPRSEHVEEEMQRLSVRACLQRSTGSW